MTKRKIIEINRDLCNGCGLCTTACAEGALELDSEGKAIIVRELYCDGMGACLAVCPTDALKVVERDSQEYDAQAAYKHVLKTRGEEAARNVHGIGAHGDGHPHGQAGHGGQGDGDLREHTEHGDHGAHHDSKLHHHSGGRPGHHAAKQKMPEKLACGCPGSMAREIKREPVDENPSSISGRSELTQWPVQLHLVSPFAPYFQNADLLVAADCTAFALGSFHRDLLQGKKVVIACPKLDDTANYTAKLAEIIKLNDIKSLTVAIMTVPCCSGLFRLVEDAVELSGVSIEPRKVVVGIDGKISG
jgi:NAD-dependent dihydropyrimidine dehydrogenase PreA subunit